MKEIDHNPNERRMTNAVWWVLWPMLLAGWSVLIYYDRADFVSALGGLGSGCILAIWAIEKTGNKTPKSWGG